MNSDQMAYVVAALGLLGGIGLGIKALVERRVLRSQAQHSDASSTALLTATARELVDPLRKELALERAEHAKEMTRERERVSAVLKELEECTKVASELRLELAAARVEADALRREREEDRKLIRELREQLDGETKEKEE